MRDSFVFYRSYYNAIKELNDEDKLKVYTAITAYALNDDEITEEGISKAIFELIKPLIDHNNKKYENGKKGGRPKSKDNDIYVNTIDYLNTLRGGKNE